MPFVRVTSTVSFVKLFITAVELRTIIFDTVPLLMFTVQSFPVTETVPTELLILQTTDCPTTATESTSAFAEKPPEASRRKTLSTGELMLTEPVVLSDTVFSIFVSFSITISAAP